MKRWVSLARLAGAIGDYCEAALLSLDQIIEIKSLDDILVPAKSISMRLMIDSN